MDASQNALRLLVAKFGSFRGPTRSGFVNFNHKRCGDRRFRLGLKFSTGVAKCFNCGFESAIEDLVPGLPRIRRFGKSEAPRRRFSGEMPSTLPWKPITASGDMTALERRVVRYLESRGIIRQRAAVLGLGYGIANPYVSCAIHPWYREDGTLGGWQARKCYDPEDGSPKILHALPRLWPDLYTPSQGGMFCYDILPTRSPVLLAEGPYDTYSGLRAVPTVGIMGSEIYAAQIRRLQRKEPTAVIYGLDPDTFAPQWKPYDRSYGPPKARRNLQRLALAFNVPLLVLKYPPNFDGDLGGKDDKSPHPVKVIEALVAAAEPYDPTL
jgi:hypothetical protein